MTSTFPSQVTIGGSRVGNPVVTYAADLSKYGLTNEDKVWMFEACAGNHDHDQRWIQLNIESNSHNTLSSF